MWRTHSCVRTGTLADAWREWRNNSVARIRDTARTLASQECVRHAELARLFPDEPFGGGTGSLAEAVLDRFPRAPVLVRDIDREMLGLARARLSLFADRVELSLGSFADSLPPADAVLSAFALHHIGNLEQKTEAYCRIREALRPRGVFLNADAVSGPFWLALRNEWAAFMAGRGFTLEQACQNLSDWAAEDTYLSPVRARILAGTVRRDQ